MVALSLRDLMHTKIHKLPKLFLGLASRCVSTMYGFPTESSFQTSSKSFALVLLY